MRRHIFTSILILSIVAAAGPLYAQSLADVSKAEEQRRKTIKTPSKVYTNKDLGNVPPAPAATPPPDTKSAEPAKDAAPAAAAAKGEDQGKPGEVKDQAYWSGRVKELQTQLERDEGYAEALQSRINALTTDWANRSDPAQREVVERDRLKALAELDRLTQAIENDKKAVADLEEEARRSGVPPGWLR
ncbi:MAG: hypothetical protein HY655_14465 [Acidobacteria bacterium]|nr:hypothetical protein [Acidobacteriota bacterium]